MIKNPYRVDLDVKYQAPITTDITFVSADNQTSSLNIYINDGNDPINYTDVATAIIIFAKSDGTTVQGDLVFDTDHYTYALGTNEIASAGALAVSVCLYGTSGERITASKFTASVLANPLSANVVESSTEFDALAKAIKLLDDVEAIVASGDYKGTDGLSAYQLAVQGGFVGTVSEWLLSLKGADGTGTGDMLKSVYDTTDSGKVNIAKLAESVAWVDVTGKPTIPTVDVTKAYVDTQDLLKQDKLLSVTAITATSGAVNLTATDSYTCYTMAITGNTTFVLPTISDNTKHYEIELQVSFSSASLTMAWGATYLFNGTLPVIAIGTFNVLYEWDNLAQHWVYQIIKKAAV